MIREDGLLKYPRTPHLEGSRLQPGDSDHDQAPLSVLGSGTVVIEEKLDGANSGISFSSSGELQLQSRGHFLTGGSREKHFNLLKQWAQAHEDTLFDVLSDRYIMFGEWMFAKHSVYYDALPHYFLEFDIFDKQAGEFLSTPRRHAMLSGVPVVSVPVLAVNPSVSNRDDLEALIGLSLGRTDAWRESMANEARRKNIDPDKAAGHTDQDDRAEGLYIKIEDEDKVLARYKFVRWTFTQSIMDQGEHWLKRPILPNLLRPGTDIFSPTIDKTWPGFRPAPVQLKKSRPR